MSIVTIHMINLASSWASSAQGLGIFQQMDGGGHNDTFILPSTFLNGASASKVHHCHLGRTGRTP